jgi:hypothetical protein
MCVRDKAMGRASQAIAANGVSTVIAKFSANRVALELYPQSTGQAFVIDEADATLLNGLPIHLNSGPILIVGLAAQHQWSGIGDGADIKIGVMEYTLPPEERR